MKHWWLAIALVGTCGVARAQDEDTISKIQVDMQKLFRMVDANQRQIEPKEGDFLALIDRCWKVYDVSAGEPEEFDALSEVLTLSSYVPGKSTKAEDHWRDATAKIVKDFADDPRIVNLVVGLPAPRGVLPKESDQILASIEAKTKSVDVKAAFEFKPIQLLVEQQSDGQLNEAETQKLLEKLRKLAADYPDAKVPRYGKTYKAWVAAKIYTIEHLKIGEVAPEIEAPDLDGVSFKLSDYRGKVVMLDFWGYW
jgi:hypothetical protein